MHKYDRNKIENYKNMLKSTGSLSRLFSESDIPYLVSRSVENIYCLAFSAENLGRSDCSADAKYEDIGIGLKTFLHGNGRTLQKIAEFNRNSHLYRDKTTKELVTTISEMRNERIAFTKRAHNVSTMIYHCVTRQPGKVSIYEEPMDMIDINNINAIKKNNNTITFNDRKNEYSFNITKSTLYKRFITQNALIEVNVPIIENPYLALENLLPSRHSDTLVKESNPLQLEADHKLEVPSVILPLFSDRGTKRNVPERSGLNQWNAKGRPRDPNEIYIPIPKWIHDEFEDFFPDRDSPFHLCVPSGKVLDAKVCQDGSKALMTNPNKDLGKWLLREVLNLPEKKLVDFDMLERLNIDSVKIEKNSDSNFSIDFCEIGTYDTFKMKNNSL
ncbi:restriction endonuclease PLD domain-containing protein [Sporosarcina ureae]|uniref:restriction endonuclease PLD domain-containing protein n=1 Tax=Sporosarcina ureae TaxID=1571 RepID=UPI0026ECD74C|nr:restriction endonuclease PLD domain-containing protein [Sporosarcina ureae]